MSPRSLLTGTAARTAAPAVVILLAIVVTASVGGRQYTVKPGDTLSAIAARYHTTVAALVRLNNLPGSGDLIYAGSTLRLPGHGGHGGGARAHHGHVATTTYTVRPGDSLYAIAARLHASPTAIARRNHLPRSLIVVIGQHLRIRHHVRGPAHSHAHHSAAAPAGFRGISIPSRTTVASMIRSTAARWHVDPRFALGISYEEAGFNQRVVSGVGAVGAMQIMPSTGQWLSTYVLHRPLNVYRAQDNVTAGVALLSVLLTETHGDMRVAAAGYYQGLASVRARGMYADTKQYVANVLALRNRF